MITEENISSIIFRDTKAVVDFYYKDETFKVSIAIKKLQDDYVCLAFVKPSKKFLAIPDDDRNDILEIVFEHYAEKAPYR